MSSLSSFPRCTWVGAVAYTFLCPSASNAMGQPESAPDESSAGRVAAELIVLHAADASDDDLQRMSDALGAIKGVIHAAAHFPEKSVSILAAADRPVTVDRAIRYLELAGYSAKEAGEDMYKKILALLRTGTFAVPVGVAGSCVSPAGSTETPAAAKLTSLAESVEPLREAFNAGKDRIRFVALLSPT